MDSEGRGSGCPGFRAGEAETQGPVVRAQAPAFRPPPSARVRHPNRENRALARTRIPGIRGDSSGARCERANQSLKREGFTPSPRPSGERVSSAFMGRTDRPGCSSGIWIVQRVPPVLEPGAPEKTPDSGATPDRPFVVTGHCPRVRDPVDWDPSPRTIPCSAASSPEPPEVPCVVPPAEEEFPQAEVRHLQEVRGPDSPPHRALQEVLGEDVLSRAAIGSPPTPRARPTPRIRPFRGS